MKIVFLDCGVVNPGDIPWEPIKKSGTLTVYERCSQDEIVQRIGDAEAVFIDSAVLSGEIMDQCPKLKFIGIAATGFNNVDLDAAKARGIAVANVPAYSTDAVAQHAAALMLAVTNKIEIHNRTVAAGEWKAGRENLFVEAPLTLLAGKSIGIIGYGNIGKKMGEIARAFGMTVNVYSKDPEAAVRSDVVSLHCPLTETNRKMVNRQFIDKMKDGAVLINTARGALIDEEALADALKSGKLAGAGLDVLSQEPPEDGSPLIGLETCYITPHIAFSPAETRKVVIDTCGANLTAFLAGESLNRLV